MHLAMLHLTPILGAEKNKLAFYIAGGVLILWALIISMVLGMRKPDFPGSKQGERAIIGVTLVLVAVTAAMAVITAEPPAKPANSPPGFTSQVATVVNPSPPAAAVPASAAAPAEPATPTATTGTPAPASSPAAGTRSTKLAIAANPTGLLAYNTKTLAARAGTVTVVMANMSPVEHNFTVASGSKVLGATPTFTGGSRSLELKLKPGTYTFYCSVPGHRQAGMEGTLTVTQ
jgi:plastocyanin